jgi:hypothetical protein
LTEWLTVASGISSQIEATIGALRRIREEVAQGTREANTEEEMVEAEVLRDLCRTLRIHAQSMEAAKAL